MSLLTPEQRDEMLIRIDERQKGLKDKMDEAFSGPPQGFVRHEVYDQDKKAQTWFRRILYSTAVVTVSKVLFDMFK